MKKLKSIINYKILDKIKVLYLIIGILLVILLMFIISICGNKDKSSNYALVYQNSDSNLLLLEYNKKKDDAVRLSSVDNTKDVVYANTSSRYVLFKKNENLYLYDKKDKDSTEKIISDVDTYKFTEDDKYVVATNNNNNLYIYNFKKEAIQLDSDIKKIRDLSNKNIIYIKDNITYLNSLKSKKESRVKLGEDVKDIKFTYDKYITFIDNSNSLYLYDIKKNEKEKILNDVGSLYADNENNIIIYITLSNELYSYDIKSKKNTKIDEDVYLLSFYNLKNKQVLYIKNDDKKYILYYELIGNEGVVVDKKLSSSISDTYIYNGKEIYYINDKNELKHVNIYKNKIGNVNKVSNDVNNGLIPMKDGYAFIQDADKKNLGTLYTVKKGNKKKVAVDVYTNKLKVSNDGKKIYYLKDYNKNKGDLYIFNGYKSKLVDSDIYTYNYVNDELIYYLKDYNKSKGRGDLYRYTNKAVKLESDIRSISTTHNSFKLDK